MSGPNSLSRSQVQKAFMLAYDGDDMMPVVNSLAVETQGKTAADILAVVGNPPKMRRRTGDKESVPVATARVTVYNDEFHSEEEIKLQDLRRDQTGELKLRTGRLAVEARRVQWNLMVDMIRNNTAIGYDGKVLFATDHEFGRSGAQKNILTASDVTQLNVTTATLPTVEEFADVLVGLRGYFPQLKDWRGEKMIRNIVKAYLLCPPNLVGIAETCIRANNLAGGETNPTQNLWGGGNKWAAVDASELFANSSSADFYVALDTGIPGNKPMVISEEVPVRVDYLGEGSEYATQNGRVLITADWDGGVAVGEPLLIHKCTLS